MKNGMRVCYSICWRIKEGDFFISFPNQIHYYRNTASGRYHIIIFSPDIISETVGFGSIRSFNRAFLEIMNTTPLHCRAFMCNTKTNATSDDNLLDDEEL